jgi:queuine tRNA-ribosyltransferase
VQPTELGDALGARPEEVRAAGADIILGNTYHLMLRPGAERVGSTGQAFTADGPLNMRNARFAEDEEPIETGCACPACTQFSRAYVHHLVKSGEILGAMLMTQHNLWFYQRMMQDLRDAIAANALKDHARSFLARYRGRC